jgi:hypothetical protein
MFGLEKYSKLFGSPSQGVHRFRIGGLAAVDLAATAGIAFGMTYYKGWGWRGCTLAFASLWLVGIGLHYVFGVKTPTTPS